MSKPPGQLTKASGNAVLGLLPWVIAGLIGPVISWTAVLNANMTLLFWLDRVAIIHPVWALRAFAMLAPSESAGRTLIALMVVANVAMFAGLGLLFRRLSTKPVAIRWGATVAAYALVYALIAVIGTRVSAWAAAKLLHG